MAGENDSSAERLREQARRFDERGRKGTLVQEQVKKLDQQNTKPPVMPKKEKVVTVEEEDNNGE